MRSWVRRGRKAKKDKSSYSYEAGLSLKQVKQILVARSRNG